MPQKIIQNHKVKLVIILAVIVMSCGYALRSYAEYGVLFDESAVAASLEKTLQKNTLAAGGTSSGVSFFDRAALQSFYKAHGYAPVWLGRRHSAATFSDILALLEDSWRHGLNPDAYHVRQIQELLAKGGDKAGLELLLSDAVMHYAHDLSGMRFDPKLIRQKAEYWRMPQDPRALLEQVVFSSRPVAVLESLPPQNNLYQALQNELVRLTQAQEDNEYDHLLPLHFDGSNYFEPGRSHKDVTALRVRLGMSYKPRHKHERYYDDETAAAVMAFQRHHGLESDGIIGPQTLSVLNRTRRDQMEQVIANLERLRWQQKDVPERYIVVNLAQQMLWAVENGEIAEEMKVVVGLPARSTKEFKAEVTGVRFNPTWTVPLNLKMRDFLPHLIEDPSYLSQKGIEVIKGFGRNAITIDPEAVDWASVDWKEMNTMRFVQSPGVHNALGAVRILMPNKYDIYMHDTNHPEFFEREQRTYSSGCVRLSEPEKIADFVLKHNTRWSTAQRDEILASGKMTEVMAEDPFPVYIVYQTVWFDKQGRLVYGSDVYKRDRRLIKVLASIDGYKLLDGATRYAALADKAQSALAYNQ